MPSHHPHHAQQDVVHHQFSKWVGPRSSGTVNYGGHNFRLLTYQLEDGAGPFGDPPHLQDAKDGFVKALQYADDNNCTSNANEAIHIPYPDGESIFFGYHDLTTGNSGWVFGFFGLKNSNGTFSNKCQAAWLDGDGSLKEEASDLPDVFELDLVDGAIKVRIAFNANGNGGCSFSLDFKN